MNKSLRIAHRWQRMTDMRLDACNHSIAQDRVAIDVRHAGKENRQ